MSTEQKSSVVSEKSILTGSKQKLECYRSVNKQDSRKYEKFLHDCFDSKHIHSEWYDLTVAEVDDFVDFLGS